ncbi:hypothetical protein R5R35_002085 [Gryllus longicercus]
MDIAPERPFGDDADRLRGNGAALPIDSREDTGVVALGDTHYGYEKENGPQRWREIFERCGGRRQSPVDLDTSTAHTLHRPHILWWNYFLKPESVLLLNDGHTVKVHGKWADEKAVPFHWAAPDGPHYVFDHIHFHWGSSDREGSEHTVNGRAFPLEMHAVHFRKDLLSLEKALKEPSGLRVVGVLFHLSEHNNTGLAPVTEALREVREAHHAAQLPPFAVAALLPIFDKQYFTYNGSLTTPPCFESVSWVLRKEPMHVSAAQMDEFRQLLGENGKPIMKNYRPPQPLNDREIVQIRR